MTTIDLTDRTPGSVTVTLPVDEVHALRVAIGREVNRVTAELAHPANEWGLERLDVLRLRQGALYRLLDRLDRSEVTP